MVDTKDRVERNREILSNGYRASILQNETHSGGGFLLTAVQHYEGIQYHWTVHLKVVKIVNSMSCIF